MVNLNKLDYIEFDWDEYNIAEIQNHNIAPEETEECFFNDYYMQRNKKKGRPYRTYKLTGRTDAGRNLVVIFYEKSKSVLRVITAWET